MRTTKRVDPALEGQLRAGWKRDTSSDPGKWSPTNPAWGQCAVTSLLLQEMFGGELLRTEIQGISHYWNRFEDGEEIDLTREQFGPTVEMVRAAEVRSRDYVLSFPETRRRYERLRRRVARATTRAA